MDRYLSLGRIVATRRVMEEVPREVRTDLLYRHMTCDWGDLSEADQALNDRGLLEGDRILSAYQLDSGEKLWIITEWDRSATTLLFPEEY